MQKKKKKKKKWRNGSHQFNNTAKTKHRQQQMFRSVDNKQSWGKTAALG
jgi:hypothetical protein